MKEPPGLSQVRGNIIEAYQRSCWVAGIRLLVGSLIPSPWVWQHSWEQRLSWTMPGQCQTNGTDLLDLALLLGLMRTKLDFSPARRMEMRHRSPGAVFYFCSNDSYATPHAPTRGSLKRFSLDSVETLISSGNTLNFSTSSWVWGSHIHLCIVQL